MINRKEVAVVIPTYKISLSETEKISLLQAWRILGDYDIYYAAPEKLSAEYLNDLSVERFADPFFKGTAGYNRLMVSTDFYKRFEGYRYILIYQLDAFVFFDRLMDFCKLKYDYIGAPWLTGMRRRTVDTYVYTNVGNGGFSLRNVQNTIRLLDRNKERLKDYSDNEDNFFSFYNSALFKVAPISIALSFAFERQVRQSFELNGNRLPFGCHAWERYDYDFWQPYIEREGYKLPARIPESGMEDQKNLKVYAEDSFKEKFWTFCDVPNMKNIKNRKIAVFGTGMYGKRVFQILKNAGIKVECFLDNDIAVQEKYLENHIVHAPAILKEDNDYFTIIAITGKNLKNVKMQLDGMGKVYERDYISYIDLIS